MSETALKIVGVLPVPPHSDLPSVQKVADNFFDQNTTLTSGASLNLRLIIYVSNRAMHLNLVFHHYVWADRVTVQYLPRKKNYDYVSMCYQKTWHDLSRTQDAYAIALLDMGFCYQMDSAVSPKSEVLSTMLSAVQYKSWSAVVPNLYFVDSKAPLELPLAGGRHDVYLTEVNYAPFSGAILKVRPRQTWLNFPVRDRQPAFDCITFFRQLTKCTSEPLYRANLASGILDTQEDQFISPLRFSDIGGLSTDEVNSGVCYLLSGLKWISDRYQTEADDALLAEAWCHILDELSELALSVDTSTPLLGDVFEHEWADTQSYMNAIIDGINEFVRDFTPPDFTDVF